MALREKCEKAGKGSLSPMRIAVHLFPSGQIPGISYADCLMLNARKPTKLLVIWETVADPDPHALLKAVAMLFNRRVSLSTGVDLTKRDDKLLCKSMPER